MKFPSVKARVLKDKRKPRRLNIFLGFLLSNFSQRNFLNYQRVLPNSLPLSHVLPKEVDTFSPFPTTLGKLLLELPAFGYFSYYILRIVFKIFCFYKSIPRRINFIRSFYHIKVFTQGILECSFKRFNRHL